MQLREMDPDRPPRRSRRRGAALQPAAARYRPRRSTPRVRRVDPGMNAFFYFQRGIGGEFHHSGKPGRVLHRDHSPERQPDRLPQRGYGLGLAALFQVQQRQPAGDRPRPRIDTGRAALGGGAPLRLAGAKSSRSSRTPRAIQSVNGPDARLIPWTSITILILLAALVIWLWRVWARIPPQAARSRMIDENGCLISTRLGTVSAGSSVGSSAATGSRGLSGSRPLRAFGPFTPEDISGPMMRSCRDYSP